MRHLQLPHTQTHTSHSSLMSLDKVVVTGLCFRLSVSVIQLQELLTTKPVFPSLNALSAAPSRAFVSNPITAGLSQAQQIECLHKAFKER